MKKPVIYVLSVHNTPLMPMTAWKRVHKLLDNNRARVVKTKPFTIKLTYDIADPKVDDCILGIDPGRTNIGLCVIDKKGRVLFASDVETRNKAIAKLMLERKVHRQARRRGERLVRIRRAIRADLSGMTRATTFYRALPGCEEAVVCKHIRNQEARFLNRKRKKGWLTPTANHLLLTHINLVKKICKLLPVSHIVIELNKFSFMKLDNPNIKNYEYQKGKLYGYKDVYEAVDDMQNGHCLMCKNDIEHYHHIVPRSQGGSDTLDNLAGLCVKCHRKIHTDANFKEKITQKQKGLIKKYGALSVLNQIMPELINTMASILPTYITTGYETKKTRKRLNLEKQHHIDAWCIAVSILDQTPETPVFNLVYQIKQFRRHNRQRIHAQTERTYYLNGKAVAKNRKPRFEKVGPALSDLRDAVGEKVISELTVKKSYRRYNNLERIMPGAVFIHEDKEYVLTAQHSNGAYLHGYGSDKYFRSKDCKIIKQNEGLVFV